MGTVIAVCTSEKRGVPKQNVHAGHFIKDYGIEGDAHAGKWHRQVSLLSADKIEAFKNRAAATSCPVEIECGAFGENIVVSGIDFRELPLGTVFCCGKVRLLLTQIGKTCHDRCAIFDRMGDCIMPREGVFTKVLEGGDIQEGDEMTYTLPFKAAVITVSDSCAAGGRKDASGPAVKSSLEKHGYAVSVMKVLPDEKEQIAAALKEIADSGDAHLILTTGGTGFSVRDVTPEATKDVIDREAPGIAEAMRFKSMQITMRAMLSRAVAGFRGRTLIVNLPGSPKGCTECLEYILDTLTHGLSIAAGISHDCARL